MVTQNTVLVAEDNDFVRMQIVSFLREVGCEVLEASEGRAALRQIATSPVKLAIVDVRMEPMGGFEFIRTIRQEGNQTPVILVTGDQSSDLLEQAGHWKVAAVLLKPVQKDRLLTMVGRVLDLGRDEDVEENDTQEADGGES